MLVPIKSYILYVLCPIPNKGRLVFSSPPNYTSSLAMYASLNPWRKRQQLKIYSLEQICLNPPNPIPGFLTIQVFFQERRAPRVPNLLLSWDGLLDYLRHHSERKQHKVVLPSLITFVGNIKFLHQKFQMLKKNRMNKLQAPTI